MTKIGREHHHGEDDKNAKRFEQVHVRCCQIERAGTGLAKPRSLKNSVIWLSLLGGDNKVRKLKSSK